MRRRVFVGVLAVTAMLLVTPALASASGVVWKVNVLSANRVSPGQQIKYLVDVENAGIEQSDGTGALDITLPSGITGVSVANTNSGTPLASWACGDPTGAVSVHCDLDGVVAAGGQAEHVYLLASAGSGVTGLQSGVARMSGSGANGSVSRSFTTTVSSTPNFGVQGFDGAISNQDGTADTQAGSHPYALTTSLDFGAKVDPLGAPSPDGNVKDIAVNLPPGLIGDPTAVAQCAQKDLFDVATFKSGCPAASQVGLITLRANNFSGYEFPVFNMVPPPGEPAQFGAFVIATAVYIDARVRSGGDYGLTASLNDVSTALPFTGSTLTLWGVPADPSHDASRGGDYSCGGGDFLNFASFCGGGGQSAGGVQKPFLTLPTACSGPQGFSLTADSWRSAGSFAGGSFVTHDGGGNPVGFEGCNRLEFQPVDSSRGRIRARRIPRAG